MAVLFLRRAPRTWAQEDFGAVPFRPLLGVRQSTGARLWFFTGDHEPNGTKMFKTF